AAIGLKTTSTTALSLNARTSKRSNPKTAKISSDLELVCGLRFKVFGLLRTRNHKPQTTNQKPIMKVLPRILVLLRPHRPALLERTAQKFVLELRQSIYAHLQAQPLAFFHERRSGDLISRVIGDVDTLQEVVINGTDTFLSNVLGMVGVAAVLIWMNWRLGLA